jgi:hypothetical protein
MHPARRDRKRLAEQRGQSVEMLPTHWAHGPQRPRDIGQRTQERKLGRALEAAHHGEHASGRRARLGGRRSAAARAKQARCAPKERAGRVQLARALQRLEQPAELAQLRIGARTHRGGVGVHGVELHQRVQPLAFPSRPAARAHFQLAQRLAQQRRSELQLVDDGRFTRFVEHVARELER